MKKVFIIRFHVKALENSIMPSTVGGAYVSCFAKGVSYAEAMDVAIKKLTEDGLYPEEVLEPVHEMDLSSWAIYIEDEWPEYVNNLPSQLDFEKAIKLGEAVYGPFASYAPK